MKLNIVISLLLLSLLSGSVFSRIKRKNNNSSRNKRTDNGDGSWKDGFTIPGFICYNKDDSNNQWNDSEDKRVGKGTFYPVKMTKTGNNELGWVFKMSNQPSGCLKNCMVGSGNEKYIPYRYFTSSVSYTNPTGYKYIQFTCNKEKADGKASEPVTLRALLPWAAFSWIITDDEGTNIVKIILDQRIKALNAIKSAKEATSLKATVFCNKLKSIELSSKSKEEQTTKINSDISETKAKIEALTKSIQELSTQIATSKQELDKLSEEFNLTKAQLESSAANIQSNENTLKAIKEDAKSIKDQKDAVTKDAEVSKTKLTANKDTLIKLIVSKDTSKFVEDSYTAAISTDAKRTETMNSSLNKLNF